MLLRTIFLLGLISLLAETLVHGSAALANAALHQRASAAAQAQFSAAIASAQSTIARAISSGVDPASIGMPSPTPTCVSSITTGGCGLFAQSTIAIATPSPNLPGGCASTDCTVYFQGNDAVTEGRIAVTLSSNVTASSGAILASRTGTATFRTFATAPYVALVGALDSTLENVAQGQTGDDGGAPERSGVSPGTQVNVEYVNALNPAATPIPGNVWRPQEEHPATAANTWDY